MLVVCMDTGVFKTEREVLRGQQSLYRFENTRFLFWNG